MFSGIAIGLVLLAIGGTCWKLKLARKATPYLLLIGSSVLTGTAAANFIGKLFTGATSWVSTVTSKWVSTGGALLMLIVSVVLTILLYHGMHPKKGKFEKKHNIVALLTPIAWVGTGGFFATVVNWLSELARQAGDAANQIGG